MWEFVEAVGQHDFMRNALATGLLVSVACGVVGTYVAVRRIGYIAGGIAHCVLGGLGAALYARRALGWDWVQPMYGAILAALGAALVIGVDTIKAKEREDTIIGAIWALGMAVGILFIFRTPGYNEDLMSFLFGNILLVSGGDLWLIVALDAVVVVASVLFYDELLALCFDQEFASLRGVRVQAFYLLLLCLTALTVVLLVTVVGVVLVIALLTLPIAVAGRLARSLWQMMALSVLLSAVFTTGGLALSYSPDLPPGATIVLLAGAVYVLVLIGETVFRRLRRA